LYKIDDVMKMTGLTKRTIRYYEEIGLITPPQRTKGNTRLYVEENINELKKIIEAKEVLGFSLQELQQFVHLKKRIERRKAGGELTKEGLEDFQERLSVQINELARKIQRMQRFEQELHELMDRTEYLKTTLEE
jgi:MerR family transcriptional regulator, repressor of the yfmOP operon